MSPVIEPKDMPNNNYGALPGGMRFDSNTYLTPTPGMNKDFGLAFGDLLSALESSVINHVGASNRH